MGRITQRVAATALSDLLERPLRAALAFAGEAGVSVLPIVYRRAAGRVWIGLARDALGSARPPERGTVVVDDGWFWFELRAITWRGRLAPSEPPGGGNASLCWLELSPDHEVAWDYGQLHEEPDP